MENWTDKDADNSYPKYIQDYEMLRNKFLDSGKDYTMAEVQNELQRVTKERLDLTYKFLFRQAIEYLRNDFSLSDEEYDDIKIKTDPLKNMESFNFDYIKELRKIEEETRERKQNGRKTV